MEEGWFLGQGKNLNIAKHFDPFHQAHTVLADPNPLPDDNILDWLKLIQLADDIL